MVDLVGSIDGDYQVASGSRGLDGLDLSGRVDRVDVGGSLVGVPDVASPSAVVDLDVECL